MNVKWYVGKFDEATWAFNAELGLKPAELRAQNRGMAATCELVAAHLDKIARKAVALPAEAREKANDLIKSA